VTGAAHVPQAHGVIAGLVMPTAAYELEATDPNAEVYE
jgi:hypothetical protein